MKVFMLGWEFPPHISGGLGTACYGITKALTNAGVNVDFVLPRPVVRHLIEERVEEPTAVLTVGSSRNRVSSNGAKSQSSILPVPTDEGTLVFHMPELPGVTFHTVDVMLSPYMSVDEYESRLIQRQREIKIEAQRHPAKGSMGASVARQDSRASSAVAPLAATTAVKRSIISSGSGNYAGDMVAEAQRYAVFVLAVSRDTKFDLVHAHDWMTFYAGMAVAAAKNKPLIVHVHSTEVDRGGAHMNQRIFEIERQGMQAADLVIAVSEFTRQIIVMRYGIAPEKVKVVHNGIESNVPVNLPELPREVSIEKDEKIVLFMGRVTAQKGPEHFLAAARKVIDVYPAVKFVMAGDGDMLHQTIELAAKMGIGHKVLFTGFLHGLDVERIFSMADLYVMPSISEPFGIAPLEAMSRDVPVIISKQSGVAEVVDHALKVDFWDIDDLANKIVAVLRYPQLSETLRSRGRIEITQLTWRGAAQKIRAIYANLHAKAAKRSSADIATANAQRPATPPAPRRRATPAKKLSMAVATESVSSAEVKGSEPSAEKPRKTAVRKGSPKIWAKPKPKAKAKPKPKAIPKSKPKPTVKSKPKAKPKAPARPARKAANRPAKKARKLAAGKKSAPAKRKPSRAKGRKK